MLQLRSEYPQLRLGEFPSEGNLKWQGLEAFKPDWSEEARFLAYTISAPEQNDV